MMKIDVREAPAGSAVDTACAEVMPGNEGYILLESPDFYSDGFVRMERRPCQFSTSWGAAGELAMWAPELALDFELEWMGIGKGTRSWSCYMGNGYGPIYARTAPLAICRAFLLASGIEEIEVEEVEDGVEM